MIMTMAERWRSSAQNSDQNSAAATFADILLFALPALALTTSFGMVLVQLLMLLSFAWCANKGMLAFYAGNFRTLAWIIAGFGGYFIVSLVRMLVFHQGSAAIDGPSRLLFGLSCIGFVGFLRPRMRWFWLGLCWGTVAAGVFALVQRFGFAMDRVDGFTHHPISFGDLALAMGMMSLCALSALRNTRLAWLPVVALVAGLMVSVLSGSRGGWVGLGLAALPLLVLGRAIHGRVIWYTGTLILALLVAAYFLPVTGVASRVAEAVSDVRLYFNGDDATTSVGIRLELWKASWLMFTEHPWLGVGRDEFYQTLQTLARAGKLQISPALTYSSSHNDVLHFLATGGLLDCSLLLLMYGAPLRFFLRVLKQPDSPQRAAALAGVVLVLCFIGFSLTDVMFWLMIPKVFYVMMVCVLIGFCLTAQELHD
jgi:O-antigen ligase